MKKYLLAFLMAAPILCKAQYNFQNGYVITINQDTLKGLVYNQDNIGNFRSVEFKPDLNSKAEYFAASNSAGYGFSEKGNLIRYRSFKVKISQSKILAKELSIGLDSSTKTEVVYLKVLQEGENITLYQYEDAIKTRYYIKEKTASTPIELLCDIYLSSDNKGRKIEFNTYVAQLKNLRSKYIDGSKGVKLNAEPAYTTNDLLNWVSAINKQTFQKVKEKSNIGFYLGGGVTSSKAKYKGSHVLARPGTKSDYSLLPSFNFGIKTPSAHESEYFFKVELAYLPGKGKLINPKNGSHHFKQSTFTLSPQFFYNLYNAKELKAFLGAGVSLDYNKYSNNESASLTPGNTVINAFSLNLQKTGISFPINTGLLLSNRFELIATYIPYTAISDYDQFSVSIQRFRFGLNYFLNKH